MSESEQSGNHSLGRRDLMKGIGATAVAAAGVSGAGSQSASAATSTYWAFPDQATARTNSMAAILAPLDEVAGTRQNDAVGDKPIVDFFYGIFEDKDRSADQLILDTYAQGQTIRDTLTKMLKMSHNNLKLAENNAVAAAKQQVVRDINNGSTQTQTELNARETVLSEYSVYQKNIIKAVESAMRRILNIRDRQLSHSGIDSPTVWYGRNGDEDIISLQPIEIELLDGSKCETVALRAGAYHTDNLQSYLLHPYFSAGGDNEVTSLREYVTNYGDFSDDSDTAQMDKLNLDGTNSHLYMEEYDSDNPRIHPFEGLLWWDSGYYIDTYLISEVHNRAYTLAGDVQTLAGDLYNAYDAGEIDVSDIMDPTTLAVNNTTDWRETGHFGYAAAHASLLGYAGDIEKTMRIDHYDDSENETVTRSGTLMLPDSVREKTGRQTFSGWTFGSELDITEIETEILDNRTSYGIVDMDGNGYAEGSDYSINFHSRTIEFLSDSSMMEGEDIKLSVIGDVPVSQTFESGTSYTVPSGATFWFASGEGLVQLNAGDTFTIKRIWNADGSEISEITASPYNYQTLSTAGLQTQLNRLEKAQQDLADLSPSGGGGGFGGGGGSLADLTTKQLAGAVAGLSGLGLLANQFGD